MQCGHKTPEEENEEEVLEDEGGRGESAVDFSGDRDLAEGKAGYRSAQSITDQQGPRESWQKHNGQESGLGSDECLDCYSKLNGSDNREDGLETEVSIASCYINDTDRERNKALGERVRIFVLLGDNAHCRPL
jgi:hypothetical protein